MSSLRAAAALIVLLLINTGCGQEDRVVAPTVRDALIVVSPHPDDESIFGAATIHRLAADPQRFVHAVYVSGGDKATVPGPCNGIPEAQKTEQIVSLREGETRAAWKVIAPDREVPIDFVRGPDLGLVASSTVAAGVRVDTLSPAGAAALARAAQLATQVPASVETVLIMTAAQYDGHPDHRTAYRAARQAAEVLHDQRHLAVRIWSWIVHDEIRDANFPTCCPGDLHWPVGGPTNDYLALTDTAARPRPPRWTHVEDVHDLVTLRHDALTQHASQVVGNPALCMPVYIPSFYTRWLEKTEEPFYEDVL